MSCRVLVVIPCYNEAERLSGEKISELLEDKRLSVLLVDDGSSDATAQVLASLSETRVDQRLRWIGLPENRGKGEAVRFGLAHALSLGADIVGYTDADFATPPSELLRLVNEMLEADAWVTLGARVARMGADIDRHPLRHYLGRVFATTASVVIGLPTYDTQCGAKFFRDTPTIRHAISQPFRSRWSFDVELLGRLTAGGAGVDPVPLERMLEVPLRVWNDVGGSKLGAKAMMRAGMDLLELGVRVQRYGKSGFYPD